MITGADQDVISFCFALHLVCDLSSFAGSKHKRRYFMVFRWGKLIRCTFVVFFVCMLGACGSWTEGSNRDSSGKPANVTVRKGDTLHAIAQRYGVPLRDLIDLNNLRPPYTLAAGQVLRLPSPSVHTVVRGDTFYGVSRRYGVPVQTLAQLNSISPPYDIKVGQRLRLTSATSKAGVATPSSTPAATPSSVPGTPSEPPAAPKQAFLWPVKGKVITPFGPIAKGRHNDGINIAVPVGTSVLAAGDGTVAYAGNELQGFGNLLLIKHAGGWMTAYAHNETLLVKKGATVKRGQTIAKSGQSGNITSPQLHFEIRKGSTPIDPMRYLERPISAAPADKTKG